MQLGAASELTRVNGAIICNRKIIDAVVVSVEEVEYAWLFMWAKQVEVLYTTLHDMGHEQHPSVIFCTKEIAIDVWFHRIRDKMRVGYFHNQMLHYMYSLPR